MNRRHYLLTIALSLSAGLAGHALSGARLTPQPVEARTAAAAVRDVQWEFCAVTKAQYAGSPQGGIYWIVYFKGEGVRTEDVRVGPTGNAFAKAVAKLGEEGWDMVGEGPLEANIPIRPGGGPNAIFFKRRKD
jgi:hypothetical protein